MGTEEVLGLRSPRTLLSVCVASVPVPLSSRAAAEATGQGSRVLVFLSLEIPTQSYPRGATQAEVGDLRLFLWWNGEGCYPWPPRPQFPLLFLLLLVSLVFPEWEAVCLSVRLH